MSQLRSDPTIAYHAGNAAHQTFRASLANAKVLAFVLTDNDAAVLRGFLTQAADAKKQSPDGNYALGKCGSRSTRTSVHSAILLTGTEINLIETELGGFRSQAMGLVYREVHRVFETYLIDLFDEIATKDKRVLLSDKSITHKDALGARDPAELHRLIIEQRKADLTRSGFVGLEKTFDGMGLPILPTLQPPLQMDREDVQRRLLLLSSMRNLIEHNRSRVNREFLSLVPDSGYKLDDLISISLDEFGAALSAVENTVDDLNRRAIDKFGLCG